MKIKPEEIYARGFITPDEAKHIALTKHAKKANVNDEGVWISFLTAKDRKLYDDETSCGYKISGIMLNDLFGYSGRSWGLVVEVETKGSDRPIGRLSPSKKLYKEYLKSYSSINKAE